MNTKIDLAEKFENALSKTFKILNLQLKRKEKNF